MGQEEPGAVFGNAEMKNSQAHPIDFSPYIDGDLSDPQYDAIKVHLDHCSQCRDEANRWVSLDDWFRGEEPIALPPFQWQQIATALQAESQREGILSRLHGWMKWKQPAWSLTLATAVLGVAVWTGLVYRNNREESRLLAAISQYELVQQSGMDRGDNPFRSPQAMDHDNESNPFAARR
jgi:hypothetical protein